MLVGSNLNMSNLLNLIWSNSHRWMRLHREACNQEDFWVKIYQNWFCPTLARWNNFFTKPWQDEIILFTKPWQGEIILFTKPGQGKISSKYTTSYWSDQCPSVSYWKFHIYFILEWKKYISHWKICSHNHTMWKMAWFWFLTCIFFWVWNEQTQMFC